MILNILMPYFCNFKLFLKNVLVKGQLKGNLRFLYKLLKDCSNMNIDFGFGFIIVILPENILKQVILRVFFYSLKIFYFVGLKR